MTQARSPVKQVLIVVLILAAILLMSRDGIAVASPDPGTDYLWISDGGDLIYQVTTADPTTAVDSHEFGTSSPFGCEENDGYIFFVDYGTDTLYKKLWSDKSDVGSWDISGYSGDAYGVAYGGGYFWIADPKDDYIYKVSRRSLRAVPGFEEGQRWVNSKRGLGS